MTPDELYAITNAKYHTVALNTDGTIMFVLPMPTKYTSTTDSLEAAWTAYEADLRKKKNRTRRRAEETGAITAMPETLALPTLKPYQSALSPTDDPAAHLQPVVQDLADNLRFDNGTLYFQGVDASRVDLVRYYDKTPKAVSDLDLPTLRALYSVILQDVQDAAKDPEKIIAQVNDPQYLGHSVKIYLPDFLQMLGYKANGSKDGVAFAVAKVMSYNRILGVLRTHYGGREYNSHFPVMIFMGYEEKDNTLHFASPYINKLIMTILQASIQTDKKGNTKFKTNGDPFLLPSHTYLVKSSIAKERNKRAVEIVCIVVTLIEQAGDIGTPHIKAQTIVDRCPDLKNALDAAATSSDKSKILRRAFSKAWELLPKQTKLAEVYSGIQFPTTIPTASQLDMVFEFSHNGKATERAKKN